MSLMSWLKGESAEQPDEVEPKAPAKKLSAEVVAFPNGDSTRKLDEDDVEEIQERFKKGETISALAAAFGVDRKTIKKYIQDVPRVSEASAGAGKSAPNLAEWEQQKALELLEKRPDLADRFIEAKLLGQSGRRPLDAETIREVHQYDDSEGWARITKDRLKQLEKAAEDLEKAREKVSDLTRRLDRAERGEDHGKWSEARGFIKELGESSIGKALFTGAGVKVMDLASSNPTTGPYIGALVEQVKQGDIPEDGAEATAAGESPALQPAASTPVAEAAPATPTAMAVPVELKAVMAMPPARAASILYQWALLGKSVGGWNSAELVRTLLPLESAEELVQMLSCFPGSEALTAALQTKLDWTGGVLMGLKRIHAEREAAGQVQRPAESPPESHQEETSSRDGAAA